MKSTFEKPREPLWWAKKELLIFIRCNSQSTRQINMQVLYAISQAKRNFEQKRNKQQKKRNIFQALNLSIKPHIFSPQHTFF